MKTNKRLICAAAALVMAFGCAGAVPGGVFEDMAITANAEIVTSEDGKYQYNNNFGEACITAYNGTDTDVVIPDTIDGLPVTRIEGFSTSTAVESITVPDSVDYIVGFYGFQELKTVNLGKGIKTIGYRAFANCTALEKLNLNKGIETVGEEAFSKCASLTKVNFGTGLQSIGREAFKNCTSLAAVNFPEGLTTIGHSAFLGDTALDKVVFPSTLTTIDNFAFQGVNITEITIPNSLTDIGAAPFCNCTSLKKVTIPDDHEYFDFAGCFDGCVNIESFNIPETWDTFMGPNNNEKIEELTIPSHIKHLGGFCNMKALKKVTIDSENIYNDNTSFSLGSRLNESYIQPFDDCTKLESVTFGENVCNILGFLNCTSLKSITFPKNIKCIEDKTFGYAGGHYQERKKYDRFTVYCYKDTAGESYAKKNGFTNIVYLLDGDVNSDNRVDVDDLVLVQKAVAGWKIDENSKNAADVTGDGVVDVDDIIYIQKKVAGWKV